MSERDTLCMPVPAPEEGAAGEAWPPGVEMILSAMDSGRHKAEPLDRRALPRLPFRVRGRLRLFSDAPHGPSRALYTRDVNSRGLGFVIAQRLPLGHGGFVEFNAPDGRPRRLQCTLQRCREIAPGWYDAAVCFNREQPEFMDHVD